MRVLEADNMADYYIDRRVLTNIRIPPAHYIRDDYNTAYQQGCKDMLALVKSITPAADVRENKQGSWMTDSDGLFICSECEEHAPQRMMFHPQPFYWTCDVQLTNFCPNCGAELMPEKLRGADMRGENNDK